MADHFRQRSEAHQPFPTDGGRTAAPEVAPPRVQAPLRGERPSPGVTRSVTRNHVSQRASGSLLMLSASLSSQVVAVVGARYTRAVAGSSPAAPTL